MLLAMHINDVASVAFVSGHATGRRCRSLSSTCRWPDEERSGAGAAGVRRADAAVPSYRQQVRSVEPRCSPDWAEST